MFKKTISISLIYIAFCNSAFAQKVDFKPETFTKKGLTLHIKDEDNSYTDAYRKRIAEVFFLQYPKLIKKYNTNSPKTVTFFIDKTYTGVAEAGGNQVRFNPAFFNKNPEDIDAITHELMHLVQGYGDNNSIPGWATEGIADYVRATDGINNTKANWTMPELKSTQNYTDAYRVTARFFMWITQNYKSDFVKKLDAAARAKKYNDNTWKEITGKSLTELWAAYVANPVLK